MTPKPCRCGASTVVILIAGQGGHNEHPPYAYVSSACGLRGPNVTQYYDAPTEDQTRARAVELWDAHQ